MQNTFYAMKRRLGGFKLTPREKLLMNRMHACPGNICHCVPRQEIIFKHKVGRNHKVYVMYWRSHLVEYNQMINEQKV